MRAAHTTGTKAHTLHLRRVSFMAGGGSSAYTTAEERKDREDRLKIANRGTVGGRTREGGVRFFAGGQKLNARGVFLFFEKRTRVGHGHD